MIAAAPGSVRLVHTMGTVISLDVRSRTDEGLDAGLAAAEMVLCDADAMFSTYRSDSWISRLARREVRPTELPPEVLEVFALCGEVERLTDGLFTARWRGDGTLDPTGLVKGWAADRASQVLTEHGLPDHCVNAAGDVVLSGCPDAARSWRIGIADPRVRGALLGVVDTGSLPDARAVATSGVAERGLHITDPRTGRAADGVLSATVTGGDPAVADGLATALVVAGPDAPGILAQWRDRGWAGCLLTAAGILHDPDGILAPRPGAPSRLR